MACDNANKAIDSLLKTMTGYQSVTGDAGSVTTHPVSGLIAATNYLYGICAMNTKNLGVRYTHLRPGSTVSGLRRNTPRWDKGYEW